MNKKIILTTVISVSLLACACANQQSKQVDTVAINASQDSTVKPIEPNQVKITKFEFPLVFPTSWKDKYKIVETDHSVSVYFNPKEKADAGSGLFFTIIKKTNDLDENRYDSVVDFKHFEFKGIAYFIGGPMDVNFSETHTEYNTFLQMNKEVPGILKPLKQYQIP
jgi:hypothetical protein